MRIKELLEVPFQIFHAEIILLLNMTGVITGNENY